MDKVVTQKLRLALYKELLNCDSKEEKTIQKQLNSVPMLFKKNIQQVLDSFDFEKTAELANTLGFTCGVNEEKISVNTLIKDAIEIFSILKDCKIGGRVQIGRLIGVKYTYETGESCYILNYVIETSETFD